MSDLLTHVSVADILGKILYTVKKPFIVFLIGCLSHGILDIVDNEHYINISKGASLSSEIDFIAFETSGLLIKAHDIFRDENISKRQIRIAAVFGALAPDIIDGIYSLIHPEKWQHGELLFPFHRYVHKDKPSSKLSTMNKAVIVTLISFKVSL